MLLNVYKLNYFRITNRIVRAVILIMADEWSPLIGHTQCLLHKPKNKKKFDLFVFWFVLLLEVFDNNDQQW